MNTARDGGGLPHIEQWEKVEWYGGGDVVTGYVYNDTRWPDGTYIRTSSVKSISEDNKRLQTRNTEYELGEPFIREIEAPTKSESWK